MPSREGSRFTRNSAFGTVAGLGGAFGSVAANVIVAHALGVERTGVVGFALWVATVAAAVADFGVQASLARYLPELTAGGRADDAEMLAGLLLRWLLVSGLAAMALFSAFAWWDDGSLLWLLVGLTCVTQTLAGFTYGLLRGMQRFDAVALLTAISVVCQLAGVAVGAVGFGTDGALAGYCAGSLVPAALAFRYAVPGGCDDAGLRAKVRRYALYYWAAALTSAFVWSRAELLFLQHWTGNAAVGYFTVGITFANIAAQGSLLLTSGLLPYFAENMGKRALPEMQAAFAAATRMLAFLVLPVCFGIAALLPVALPLIYGSDFAPAVPAAAVMVLAAGVPAIASASNSILMATDRSDFIFVTGIGAAMLAVAAGLTVIPAYGVMGAAWARAAIQISAAAFGSWFVCARLGFRLPAAALARLIAAAAVCGLSAWAGLELASGAGGLVIGIAAGIIGYGVAVRVLRALDPADVARLGTLCRGFPAGLRIVAERSLALLAPAMAARSGCDAD